MERYQIKTHKKRHH